MLKSTRVSSSQEAECDVGWVTKGDSSLTNKQIIIDKMREFVASVLAQGK